MAAKAKKAAAEEPEAEEDEGAAEAEAAATPKRRFSLKLIIIVVGALAVIGGGGTAGWLFFAGHKEAKPVAAAVKPPTFFDVPEVLVNLAASGGERAQYLKIKIVLELPDATLQPHVQTTLPRVMDTFQTYLRELRPSDLDGSAGLYRLKEELTRRVNAAVAPGRINAVLFKEIIIQ